LKIWDNAAQNFFSSFVKCIIPLIQKVSITLPLPLTFFQVVEKAVTGSVSPLPTPVYEYPECCWKTLPTTTTWTSPSDSQLITKEMSTWLRFDSIISTALPHLRYLLLWFDHTAQNTWTSVHEHALTAPLTTLINRNPNLCVHVYLPKLHPRDENPDRHFTLNFIPVKQNLAQQYLDSNRLPNKQQEQMQPLPSSPPFSIHRFLRQRYSYQEDRLGRFGVEYISDFPLCWDDPQLEDMSMAKIEEFERSLWKSGADVAKELLGFYANI
jgi:hypothetical protein